MAAKRLNVTAQQREPGEIPEVFTAGLAAWTLLQARGVFKEIGRRFRLQRKGGCTGVELVAKLFLMMFCGLKGQRALERAATGHRSTLAVALDVARWHGQSSMSRAMASVTVSQSNEMADWLLGGALGVGDLDCDASAMHRDTLGEHWRVFDVDGRVKAIRQRGLPEGDDLPDPKRLAETIAKAGYPGRKRGEVQFHRMILQDAGTGRWLGVRSGPGGGDHCEDMKWAAQRAALWADRLSFERTRSLLRFDGKAGGAPSLLVCIQAGIGALTRLPRYEWLRAPDGRALLDRGPWHPVQDSGSGPRREAMEFGLYDLGEALDHSVDPQVSAPQVRVVVSRYRLDDDRKHGCGVELEGFVYELYAATMPADAWPAAEVVTLYYGRSAEENAFEQLDKVTSFNHVVSWHPAGQQLVAAIALLTSNIRLLWGAELAGWRPEALPPQPLASPPAEIAPLPTELVPPAPASPTKSATDADPAVTELVHSEFADPPAPHEPCDNDGAGGDRSDADQTADSVTEKCDGDVNTAESPPEPGVCTKRAASTRRTLARLVVLAALSRQPVARRLENWKWDHEHEELRCPADHALRLHALRSNGYRGHELVYRMTAAKHCVACPHRAACTRSEKPSFRKEMTFTVPDKDVAAVLGGQALEVAPRRPPKRRSPTRNYRPATGAPPAGGPYAAASPALLACVLRGAVDAHFAGCRITIELPAPRAQPRTPPWLVATAAQRQHRRRTWAERAAAATAGPARPQMKLLHPRNAPARAAAKRVMRSLISSDREGFG